MFIDSGTVERNVGFAPFIVEILTKVEIPALGEGGGETLVSSLWPRTCSTGHS